MVSGADFPKQSITHEIQVSGRLQQAPLRRQLGSPLRRSVRIREIIPFYDRTIQVSEIL